MTRGANDVAEARRIVRAKLGSAAIASLHRRMLLLDALGGVAVYALVAGLALALSRLPFGVPWLSALVLQGFALQLLVLFFHDAFLHRKVGGGGTLTWALSLLFTLPALIRPTAYRIFHQDHHRHIGTDRDTEAFKQRIDTRLKRLAFLTMPGIAALRRWPVNNDDPALARTMRVERLLALLFVAAMGVAAWRWPRLVLLGYALPALSTLPVASVVRIVLEHAEADPANVFHLATFYRTGPLTRALFLWDSGDCHVVHHIFPNIPFYRIGEALAVMRPILLRHGVVERTSLAWLLKGYFIDNHAHRAPWPREAP